MKPSEISLFTAKEQTLLVATENRRLEPLSEDELVDLLGRVRRARNKYSDLHRRQASASVKRSGKRAASGSSNERTLRKAEIFEDAVSRVARHVSRAARANANEVKAERLAAARTATSATTTTRAAKTVKRPAGTKTAKGAAEPIVPARKGSTSARNRRTQSAGDARGTKS